ncbi:hypothetical protein SLS62_007365 [Diatrype stigma]|uniref:FAD/NAD(P)-binding domain-containing protein n=1 Tax=Diatrype stigma TaxID=117547 RepID=A0AAN9YQS3_9PEZI
MAKTVVVLGAGLVGVPLTHYLLRKAAISRVVLVSPNEEFYWNLSSPRVIAAPALIPENKYLFTIAKEFARYPKDKFEFVVGKAETLDPAKNSVAVKLNDGGSRTIDYHTVFVTTGSRYRESMPWKNLETSQQTRAAIAQLQREVQAAKSIVVAGAGVTGVEFAGELAAQFCKNGGGVEKEVTLVSSDPLPLEPRLLESVREIAKQELEQLGVRFIGGARITKTSTSTSGDEQQQQPKTLELTKADGSTQTITADVIIPTYGLVPNAEFAPASMRDGSGRLRTDKRLRAAGHENVFVLGDVGNLQRPQASHAEFQLRHLMAQLDPYLESGRGPEEYQFDADKVTLGLTIGPDRGTGQIGADVLPSDAAAKIKRRHIGASHTAEYAAGVEGMRGAWP